MGRPTKRRLTPPATPGRPSPGEQHGLAASVVEFDFSTMISSSSTEFSLETINIDPLLGLPLMPIADTVVPQTEGQSNSSDESNHTPTSTNPGSTPDNSGSAMVAGNYAQAPSSSCACLASFYLAMDDLCKNTNLVFPSGLTFLSDRLKTATQIAHCQICPTQYLTAMQNTQLLGALLMSIARQYGVVLDSIEKEKESLVARNGNKYIQFEGPSATLADDGAVKNKATYSFEVSASEWANLARRAVKKDVYGSNCKQESLWTLVEFVVQRQKTWHAVQAKQDQHHRHSSDKEPLCLKIIQGIKQIIGSLKFIGENVHEDEGV
ncbi:hypothetical protein ACLX1H_000490 [Fusarium chlamydosporum]